jgi:FkbM family methyltransferase
MSIADLIEGATQRLARLGAACKRVFGQFSEIGSGPGKGLRFDAGPHTHRFASGQYEFPVQEALAALVKRGDVCYDIGANLGFFSVLLGRLAGPTGSIYAFEPVPRNASTIERNARLNRMDNITVMRIAVSSGDGQEELLLAHHVGGAVLKSAGAPPDLAGSLIVETASLDMLLERQQIKPPNIAKIDIEGAEMEALQGMERILRAWTPAIILELDDETSAGCERKTTLCRSYLHDLGFRTKLLRNSYPDGQWFVRHVLAQREVT